MSKLKDHQSVKTILEIIDDGERLPIIDADNKASTKEYIADIMSRYMLELKTE